MNNNVLRRHDYKGHFCDLVKVRIIIKAIILFSVSSLMVANLVKTIAKDTKGMSKYHLKCVE